MFQATAIGGVPRNIKNTGVAADLQSLKGESMWKFICRLFGHQYPNFPFPVERARCLRCGEWS